VLLGFIGSDGFQTISVLSPSTSVLTCKCSFLPDSMTILLLVPVGIPNLISSINCSFETFSNSREYRTNTSDVSYSGIIWSIKSFTTKGSGSSSAISGKAVRKSKYKVIKISNKNFFISLISPPLLFFI